MRSTSFWIMLIAIGYIIAINGMLLGSGGSIALLTLPTALLPLLPTYYPTNNRFRLTILLSVPAYFVVVAVFLYNSMLPFSMGDILSYGINFALTIPSFFIRGPFLVFVGAFEGIGQISGFLVGLLVIGVLRKLSTASDCTLKILLSFLIVSFAMGFVESYQLGTNVSTLGQGFFYTGSTQ